MCAADSPLQPGSPTNGCPEGQGRQPIRRPPRPSVGSPSRAVRRGVVRLARVAPICGSPSASSMTALAPGGRRVFHRDAFTLVAPRARPPNELGNIADQIGNAVSARASWRRRGSASSRAGRAARCSRAAVRVALPGRGAGLFGGEAHWFPALFTVLVSCIAVKRHVFFRFNRGGVLKRGANGR
jgi:hypothetical protein